MKNTSLLFVRLAIISFLIVAGVFSVEGQDYIGKGNSTNSTPFPQIKNIVFMDLDDDGDPDVLKGSISDGIPILWIDDDDDMTNKDTTGDLDNDCLLIDRNKDGIFASYYDLSIDRIDEDNDGFADIEIMMENYNPAIRGGFDWSANYIVNIDLDRDHNFSYVNWAMSPPLHRGWEHDGNCGFYNDYSGQTLFTKMSISSPRNGDFRYSWENPFLFYDYDDDGYSEAAIRFVDDPIFRNSGNKTLFEEYSSDIDVLYNKKINYVAIAYDMDNGNRKDNEFDFDLSLRYTGNGFGYSDQVHKIKNTKREVNADQFFFDARWRKITELIYPNHEAASDLIYKRGDWNKCWMVFDEDNDCKRWERVEFYQPNDPFLVGRDKGGVDNNPQADAAGDRGEWDEDFSGKGQLYIGRFDGLLHLYGAEWGCWRMDPFSKSFQGYGGLYDTPNPGSRLQTNPSKFATVRYTDTDNNGFFDKLEFDLDSNKTFEKTIYLEKLGISDNYQLISIDSMKFSAINSLYAEIAENNWKNVKTARQVAIVMGFDSSFYDQFMYPKTLRDKYYSGYWLSLHVYIDLSNIAKLKNDKNLQTKIDKAYFDMKWDDLLNYTDISENVSVGTKNISCKIYPNPVKGMVNIDLTNNPEGKFKIGIYDVSGKLINELVTKNQRVEINVVGMKTGYYYVRITHDNSKMGSGNYYSKFFVEI